MAFVNDNYCNLKDSYLFSQIAQKVNAYVAEHPEKKVIGCCFRCLSRQR